MAISELVDSLFMKMKSIDLLRSALLIARIDNEHFDLNDYSKADSLAERIKSEFQRMQTTHNESNPVRQLFNEMGSTEALWIFITVQTVI